MVLPLLPFIPAGIAALGGAARFAGSPTGQRVVQGGLNLFNRGLTGLQNFVQPTGQMITNQAIARPLTAGTTIPLTMQELAGAISPALQSQEPSAADVEEALEKEPSIDDIPLDAKETKEREKKKKIKRTDAIEALTKMNPNFLNLSKERQEKQIKSYMDALNLKKGGYVKKKRKRKPYKPSSFVKMKGRKRFI
jgi:cell division ATPase FtsA